MNCIVYKLFQKRNNFWLICFQEFRFEFESTVLILFFQIGFQSWASNSMGFQVAFSLGFSMAFVSAFFIIFYVKERVSKAKHLQIVSGVEVLTFWLSSFVWDLFFFLIPAVGVIITFTAFQEEGFSTGSELGKINKQYTALICTLPTFFFMKRVCSLKNIH